MYTYLWFMRSHNVLKFNMNGNENISMVTSLACDKKEILNDINILKPGQGGPHFSDGILIYYIITQISPNFHEQETANAEFYLAT